MKFQWIVCFMLFELLTGGLPTSAAVDSAPYTTYGQLMIEDQQKPAQTPWEASIISGYDVSNPYLNTFNVGADFLREFHPLFSAGLEAVGFFSNASRFNRTIQNDLNAFGVAANDERPQFESFVVLKTKLLNGRVNLLGRGALPFRLNVKVGTGLLWLNSRPPVGASTWGLESQIGVAELWMFALRFDQDLQGFASRGSAIYRNRIGLGASYLF